MSIDEHVVSKESSKGNKGIPRTPVYHANRNIELADKLFAMRRKTDPVVEKYADTEDATDVYAQAVREYVPSIREECVFQVNIEAGKLIKNRGNPIVTLDSSSYKKVELYYDKNAGLVTPVVFGKEFTSRGGAYKLVPFYSPPLNCLSHPGSQKSSWEHIQSIFRWLEENTFEKEWEVGFAGKSGFKLVSRPMIEAVFALDEKIKKEAMERRSSFL
ncbi:MAG: hypothetical protein WC595_06215 [Candidatus Nanoarchaeia archaeon]